MIFTSIILVTLAASLAPPASAEDWDTITQSPSVSINGISMLPDGDHGWAVGSDAGGGLVISTILRTADGQTWEHLLFPGSESFELNAVHFIDQNHGWVAGDGGVILATTDGGDSWTVQPSGTARDLASVHFLDALEGWAVGGSGDGSSYLVLYTADGGSTWENLSFGTNCYSVEDVWFTDSLRGWICGADSSLDPHIHHTEDGGLTWTRQAVNPALDKVAALEMVTPDIGWAVTSGLYASPLGAVLHTTDGGGTWSIQYYTNFPYNYCLDAQEGDTDAYRIAIASVDIFTADRLDVIVSEDSGVTWERYATQVNNYTHAIQFVGDEIWCGSWWSQILHGQSPFDEWDWAHIEPLWNSICWADEQTGWLVYGPYGGGAGYTLRTTNGGGSWQRVPGAPGGNQVAFATPDAGWMLWGGQGASVWRTTDGGATWSRHYLGTGNWIEGIHFVTADLGWAHGSNGTLRRTTDGGVTWSAQSLGTSLYCQIVRFVDENTGWAAGGYGSSSGFMRHTTNGGATWTTQTMAVNDHVTAGSFADPLHGWVAGVGGRVQRTADGGETWELASQVNHTYVDGLVMLSKANGYLLARNHYGGSYPEDGRGFIYHTLDGGDSWTLEWEGEWPRHGVSDLAAQTADIVWACGGHTTLLRYADLSGVDEGPVVGPSADLIRDLTADLTTGLRLSSGPNPVTSVAHIQYELTGRQPVRLSLYDCAGREIRVLLREAAGSPGAHQVNWDGRDRGGRRLPAGTYYLRLETDTGAVTRPIQYVR